MSTLQSRKPRWAQYNRKPGAFARRRAARERASRVSPTPEYPAIVKPGAHTDEWVSVRLNGHTVRVQLGAPGGKGRSDQRSAWVDGELLAPAVGLTALFDLVRGMLPSAPSLRALASVQNGFTAQDELDASHAS